MMKGMESLKEARVICAHYKRENIRSFFDDLFNRALESKQRVLLKLNRILFVCLKSNTSILVKYLGAELR